MPPSKFPKNLLKVISPETKKWVDKYRNESTLPKDYIPNFTEFLKYCEFVEKEIFKIESADVKKYLKILEENGTAIDTLNRRKSAISGLGNFLRTNYPKEFHKSFLANIPGHEKTEENPDNQKPISLEQLSAIREYNLTSREKMKDQYIFETFFQLGIGKNELLARQFPTSIDTEIIQLIRQVPASEVKEGTINSYFTRITKHLVQQGLYSESEPKINSFNLTNSYKVYFFTCPNCGSKSENIATNWVLARSITKNPSYKDEYRIVCKNCKGERSED